MIVGIILAGGEGNRLGLKGKNKTCVKFAGQPLVEYGARLFSKTCDKTLVVINVFPESVKKSLRNYEVSYAFQKSPEGTGDAARVAVDKVSKVGWQPDLALIGYGDHMMFYSTDDVNQMVYQHQKNQAQLTIVTTEYSNPNYIAWGRVIRNKDGLVEKVIEQKDASKKEKKIKELNAGFYCFNYEFLKENISSLKRSPVSNEYYLTDMVEAAIKQDLKVCAFKVPFSHVGIGINTPDQLKESEELYKSRRLG